MISHKNTRIAAAVLFGLLLAAPLVWIWAAHGAYGIGVLLRRGGTYWVDMAPDDPRLPPPMRRALQDPPPEARAGDTVWSEPEPGFEVAEMPVIAEGAEVDRLLLARVDPRRFRFVVRNAPAGDKDIDQWERALPEAALIVNAAYFGAKGLADTPIISEGAPAGPRDYAARGGAFVDRDGTARLVDLGAEDWTADFTGATNALVSYPMLIGEDGRIRTASDRRWLANRTFLGMDGAGRILVGTTKEAFFSLPRLATFLKRAPLDLRLALNLDGGPVSCRSVRLPRYQQKFYAQWETQYQDGRVSLLRSVFPSVPWGLPTVLTVERR